MFDAGGVETTQSFSRRLIAVAFFGMLVSTPILLLAPEGAAATSQTFTLGMTSSVTSANPFRSLSDADFLFRSYVYDYLMFPDEDGKPAPNLAEEWNFMDGSAAYSSGSDFSSFVHPNPIDWPIGSIWQYNLTHDAYWNDGELFTADDVKFTLDIQTGSNFMTYWNFQPYTRWIYATEKVDDYTIRVFFADHTTKAPVSIAWGDSLSIPMMPSHLFWSFPVPYLAQQWDGLMPVGTGPFMGTAALSNELIAKEQVTLTKNPYYDFTDGSGNRIGLGGHYGRMNQISTLIMKFYVEEQALVLDLKVGNLDVAEITPAHYLAIRNDPAKPSALQLVDIFSPIDESKMTHWNVDTRGYGVGLSPVRLDPAIWRATAIATNKSIIVDNIFHGLASPGAGIISSAWPKWFWDSASDSTPTVWNLNNSADTVTYYSYYSTVAHVMDFNKTRANEILDAAGYDWTGTPYQSVRKVGMLAAQRLVDLGIVATTNDALYGTDGITPRTLSIENFFMIENWEDEQIVNYIQAEWAGIGVYVAGRAVNTATWYNVVYTYNYMLAQTNWRGDVDPNYQLYAMSGYALDSWNEWGTNDPAYDALYLSQASTMDVAQREQWIDECQKMQYLWGHVITTCYPKSCFGYNEIRWTNWGNWTAHPGLSIDADWCETPLFYHLSAVGATYHLTDVDISGVDGDNGWYNSQVTIWLNASGNSPIVVTHYTIARMTDNGIVGIQSGNYTGAIVTDLADGKYVLNYSSEDQFGHIEPWYHRLINIDTTGPSLAFEHQDGFAYGSGTVDIKWTASDATSGIDEIELTLDSGAPISLGNSTMQKTLQGLANGNHRLSVNVTDVAGLTTEKEFQFTVEGGIMNDMGLLAATIGLIVAAIIAAVILVMLRLRKPDAPTK